VKSIVILGSTGSIGVNTLDVVARHPEQFRVLALTAQKNIELLFEQCRRFNPQYVVVQHPEAAKQLQLKLKSIFSSTEVLMGEQALMEVASLSHAEIVMAAIVGAAGLMPTLAAIRAGKRVLLANKEALVMAGSLLMEEVYRHHAVLLPIDSEHNAIFQCLPSNFQIGNLYPGVRKIILTASGGAFRDLPISELAKVTPEQACAHPNWNMGRKITVDCATMMNKGLEVIEAYWLFGLPLEQIEVVLHPQSAIHSLVEYIDSSMLAQLGSPDMRIPIAHALAWPERIDNQAKSLDLLALQRLDFLTIDYERYPCLDLAYQALKTGGTATAILNAANEVAVEAFLNNEITFSKIFAICDETLRKVAHHTAASLEVILEDDHSARQWAKQLIQQN